MTLAWPRGIGGPLSEAQLSAFFDDGVVIVRRVFDRVEVGMMRRAFERLRVAAGKLPGSGMHNGSQFVVGDRPDGKGTGNAIQRVVWCGAAEPVLDRLGRDKRLLRMAAQLLGSREMDQLINQAHFKYPGDGVEFAWHQDSRHRRFGTDLWSDLNGKGSFVETVTAIDPMTPDNGPLKFILGSPRRGHLETHPGSEVFVPSNDAWFDEDDAFVVELEPGDVALFGPYVIHGSDPNEGEQPRRSFLNGFAYPGANKRVYPGDGAGRFLRV